MGKCHAEKSEKDHQHQGWESSKQNRETAQEQQGLERAPQNKVKRLSNIRDENFTFSKNVQQGFKISRVLTEKNFLKVVDKFLRWDSKSLGMC
jgi:hypothetical protein